MVILNPTSSCWHLHVLLPYSIEVYSIDSSKMVSNPLSSRLKSSMPLSNAIWPFKIYLSQNNPSKTQPQIENEDVTWSPQYNMLVTRTNKRRALSLQEVELDGWFLILHIVLETCTIYCNSCTTLMWILSFISIFLDWRLEFEPALQFKSWNLRALQNETHVGASILNIDNPPNSPT